MPFSARNARYLRISSHTVLPLYIYLDDKHIEWMSDYTLQRVLEDLRPVIGPKLRAENNLLASKKSTGVEVHRGDTYQFAYFFRRTEPHAVLIKSRKFVPAPAREQPPASATEPQEAAPTGRGKRKRGRGQSKSQSKVSAPAPPLENSNVDDSPDVAGSSTRRRSQRPQKVAAGGYQEADAADDEDIVMADSESEFRDTDDPDPPAFELPIDDDEEEKPKLAMQVTYNGFTIYDRCLCVVVEPWPVLRRASRAPSAAPPLELGGMRMASAAPPEQVPIALRARTPLFLPDLDPRRSETPAPVLSRIFPPVPLFDDEPAQDAAEAEDADVDGGMMAFTQVLKSAGGERERAGSADEDEDGGEAFMGDADERKGEA